MWNRKEKNDSKQMKRLSGNTETTLNALTSICPRKGKKTKGKKKGENHNSDKGARKKKKTRKTAK